MKVAVVTGAGGFIGTHLVRALRAGDVPVLAIDRSESPGLLRLRELEGVTTRGVDDDVASWRAALEGVAIGTVHHLAGGRVADGDPAAQQRANVAPLAALFDALADRVPATIVLASSGEVYGAAPAPFREDGPTVPETGYGIAKLAAEQLGFTRARQHGIPFVVARLSVVYGPGQGPGMFVPDLVDAVRSGRAFDMTAGEQWRDFVHVEDAVAALCALGATPAAHGAVVNVGSGDPIQLRDVARFARELAGGGPPIRIGALPYREGEAMDYRFDVSRLTALTGCAARISLREGLQRLLRARGPENPG